jgi:voltage-gated potassium channel
MVKGLIALIRTLRDPELRGLALLVVILFAFGTVFYTLVEDWSGRDSLCFSVMTLLTVGYGDLVPTTAGSKVFTMLYVLIGVGILVAFITMVAREAVGLPGNRSDSRPGVAKGRAVASDAFGSPWATKRITCLAGPACGR